jgi:uncharacterized protein (TIGR03067 family)
MRECTRYLRPAVAVFDNMVAPDYWLAKGEVSMHSSVVCLSLAVETLLLAAGCGKSPSGPGVGANLDPKVTADELNALSGTWVYQRQVVEGKEIPIADLSNSTFVINGSSWVLNGYRADGKQMPPMQSAISVDPTANPKQMDRDESLPWGKRRRPAIYELEGEQLTLCWNNNGSERPTTFDSPTGSSFVLTVLRRESK